MTSRRLDSNPPGPIALVLLGLLAVSCSGGADTVDPEIIASELSEHVHWLASDALGGREAGTREGHRAAQYIANEFARYGLRPGTPDGDYLQPFPFTAGVRLGTRNTLSVGEGEVLLLDTDWRPTAFSRPGEASGRVVFAGYGISVPEEGYDDYADVDVRGRMVLILPYGPSDPAGGMRFPGRHPLRRKAAEALQQGAAGVLIAPHPAVDPAGFLEPLRFDNSSSDSGLPVATVTRSAADRILGGEGRLESLQVSIDEDSVPRSALLETEVGLRVDLQKVESTGWNVMGVLPADNPQAPWLVIGAHFDHLGLGGEGSLDPGTTAVHNGADDNASGAAALLEIAQHLASSRPSGRNLLFTAFSAEEKGLLGSAWMSDHLPPEVGLPEAMLNMDMVGRLRDDALTIYGTGSSPRWDPLLDELNGQEGFGFTISRIADGFGPSDHSSFYAKEIPVLHFFTGTHEDYHRPSDDADRIEYPGLERVARFVSSAVEALAGSSARIAFQQAPSPEPVAGGRMSFSSYSGIIPDFSFSGDGLRITGASEGSPAAIAGLTAADVITRFGDRSIHNIYDYTYALQESSPGQRIRMEIRRGDSTLEVQLVLGNRRTDRP